MQTMFVKFLIFVFVFALKSASACLYNTFYNTSVTVSGVRRSINTIDGCFSPNNNDLERVSLVQILNQTVPILYEDAFNNLEYLLDIIMENDGIQEIKPKAFKNLPKLYLIRLKHNAFKEIRGGIFNNLPLTELILVNNQIEIISTEAFDDMPNLSIILLGDNKLKIWNPDWFRGSPKLTVLNFENNLFARLPTRAFQNIKGVHVVNKLNVSTSIHLNNNKIQVIDDDAFDGLETLGWLFLQKNEINEFNSNSLGNLRHMDWLRLDQNNLQCIPQKVADIAPNVVYYLDGNPLTDDCVAKFNISRKGNGQRLIKFNISIN